MKMQSNDLIILEAINGLESEMNQKFEIVNKRIDNLETEIKDTRNELLTEIRLNQHDIAHLQTSVYWGFAIMAFVVAFVSLYPFKHERPENLTEQKKFPTEERVQEIATSIAEKVMSKALAGISR